MVHHESLQTEEIFKAEFKSYPLVGIKTYFAGYVVTFHKFLLPQFENWSSYLAKRKSQRFPRQMPWIILQY